MSTINGTHSSPPILPVQRAEQPTGKPAILEAKAYTQEISDLAKQPGMLSLMMEKQNLRPDTTQATSAAPKRTSDETSTDSTAKMLKLSVASEGDANKAERLAGAVPGLLTSQLNITQPNNKPAESSKMTSESTISSASSSSGQPRSQPVVAGGGTDITAVTASGLAFVNVVGPMSQLNVLNTLTTVLWESERDAYLSATKASERGMHSAGQAGDRGIAAAKDNMTGAAASAAMGGAMHGAIATKQFKAYKNEGTSLNKNLKPAIDLEKGVKEHNNRVASSANSLDGNTKSQKDFEAVLKQHQPHDEAKSELLRNNHTFQTLNTQKTRAIADCATQATNSAQSIVQSATGISAAEQQKEAELARANRDVNNELASTQTQVGKKAAETNAALKNMTDSILNANNSAASSIAERTR